MNIETSPVDLFVTPWEAKAHRVIGELCFASWEEANPGRRNGRRPKKDQPYHPPLVARQLVAALGTHDAAERERSVKEILLHHNYLIVTGGHD